MTGEVVAAADAEHGILVDTSCQQGSLARLLQVVDPAADPRLILGNTADTRVREVGEHMEFVDVGPALAGALAASGYLLRRHELAGPADLGRARSVLASGRPIAAEADTFYLHHYWIDRGRVHMLHSVVLEDFEEPTSSVRLVDAVPVTFFDGRVALADLEPALLSGRGQAWLELSVTGACFPPGRREARAALDARIRELADGAGDGGVTGLRLAEHLLQRLDGFLAGARQLYAGGAWPGGRDPTLVAVVTMWNYHHTLRWFGRYLNAMSELGGAPAAAEAADRIHACAQDWLVARHLLMRMSGSDPVRLTRFGEQVRVRLGSAMTHTRSAVAALAELRGSL